MAIRCTDTEGRVLPQGEPGEIEMRGVACTLGYWNKPEEVAKMAVFLGSNLAAYTTGQLIPVDGGFGV